MTWELDGGPEEKSIHTSNLTFLNFRNIEVIITLFFIYQTQELVIIKAFMLGLVEVLSKEQAR